MQSKCYPVCNVLYREGSPPSFLMKAALGMSAGAIGSIIGTPAEVALIRMTTDGRYVGVR